MRLMAGLLRQGRYADEIMNFLEKEKQNSGTTMEKVGRNDPCPCGSGKKYNHCHDRPPTTLG
jgi:uncharacterized protein YecA (UPF0149 family)